MENLRDYQKTQLTAILEAWGAGNKRILAQLPTGGGKTVMFAEAVRDFARRGETSLVLVHREELLNQAAAKISALVGGEAVGIVKAGYEPNYDRPVQIASIQTLIRRLGVLEAPSLIVIDEAHHITAKTYRSILAAYPDAYQLGVTATPIRLDGKGFRDLFDRLIVGVTVSELIEAGYLSRFSVFGDPNPMTTKGVRKRGGDFSASDLAEANDARILSGNLIESYRRHANGKRCLVFAVNVAHSMEIADRYNAAGIPAWHLDGKTPPDERKDAIEAFRRGEIKVITNCALFDEGLDIPALEAVQIAKPTNSLGRWLQMVGRALRPDVGKECAIVIDHTDNWDVHGFPTELRIWTLDGVEEIERANRKLVKNPLTGEIEEIEIDELDTELIEIPQGYHRSQSEETEADEPEDTEWVLYCEIMTIEDWKREIDALLFQQRSSGFKDGWVYYRLIDMQPPLYIWESYESYKGYKKGWAKYRYCEQLDNIDPWSMVCRRRADNPILDLCHGN